MTDKEKSLLVEQYGIKISRIAHRMIWDTNIAEEATQEVWYEVLKSLDRFKGESNISTWIYTIARRTILRYVQAERVLSAVEFDDHFNLEHIAYQDAEEDRKQWVKEKCDYCLTAFCHCLTNDARLIFLFRDLAELTFAQIAQIMELNEDNVRKIASRSREKVKSFMDKDCVLVNSSGKCRCRIQKHIRAVELDKEYHRLKKGVGLIELFDKFDKELPRKNYWKKNILGVVTE